MFFVGNVVRDLSYFHELLVYKLNTLSYAKISVRIVIIIYNLKFKKMNNYHFYEEEAKGKFSVIFKARKKRKLDFVAIKRL
jgi:predicted Zn-dependent protease